MLANLLQQGFDLLGLPYWAGTAAVLGLLALASPWILKNRRTDRARRHLKEALRTYGAAREKLEDAALAEVADLPLGLLVIAEEADRNGRFGLRDRAMAALRKTGKLPYELRKLEQAVEGPMPATAAEALVRVLAAEREGLHGVATEKLTRYRQKWPDDPELAAHTLRPPPDAPAGGPVTE